MDPLYYGQHWNSFVTGFLENDWETGASLMVPVYGLLNESFQVLYAYAIDMQDTTVFVQSGSIMTMVQTVMVLYGSWVYC
jgi:hypothetical protein